jgi:hypothetical protein
MGFLAFANAAFAFWGYYRLRNGYRTFQLQVVHVPLLGIPFQGVAVIFMLNLYVPAHLS